MRRGSTALAVAAIAMAAVPAAAAAAAATVSYQDRFTTSVPGAASGRLFSDEIADAADPQAKPPAMAHFHLQLPAGARFDTSAIPVCGASDAQLMAEGASACAAGSRVGGEVFVADTGFDPNRFITADVDFLNEKDGLIILSRDRQSGARVVTHGKVGPDSEDIDLPMLPGTPPDGGVDKRENALFTVAGGYLTTPPTCPAIGYWVLRATYTFRDGSTQVHESHSPCRAASNGGGSAPRVAFFHRQHAHAGAPSALRVRSAAAAHALLEIKKGGRIVSSRELDLPAGRGRIALPALPRGVYRVELSLRGTRTRRSATLVVR